MSIRKGGPAPLRTPGDELPRPVGPAPKPDDLVRKVKMPPPLRPRGKSYRKGGRVGKRGC